MKVPTALPYILLLVLAALVAVLYYNVSSSLAIYPEEAKQKLKNNEFDSVIDVRSDLEWNTGHYPLALHIPIGELEKRLPEAIKNKDDKILFYCNTSTRSRMAAEKAQALGYKNVRYLIGTHINLL